MPASCTDTEFRQMWQDFEWENKVSVNTTLTDLHEYLKHLLKSTNMKCLTPEKALSGQCGFMAANMYARSIFGEDALANLSIEKILDDPNAAVTGHIRIRAKSQVAMTNFLCHSVADLKTNICFFLFQGHGIESWRQNQFYTESNSTEDRCCRLNRRFLISFSFFPPRYILYRII